MFWGSTRAMPQRLAHCSEQIRVSAREMHLDVEAEYVIVRMPSRGYLFRLDRLAEEVSSAVRLKMKMKKMTTTTTTTTTMTSTSKTFSHDGGGCAFC